MNDMKAQIELQLIANMISAKCSYDKKIIFDQSLCSQERCIRFETTLLREIFPVLKNNGGAWQSGHFFMYEMHNGADCFRITCSVSYKGLSKAQKKACSQLLSSTGASYETIPDKCYVKVWDYPGIACKQLEIAEAVDDFLEFELPYFETELAKWNRDRDYNIKDLPSATFEAIKNTDLPDEILVEGGMHDILTNKYERNMVARRKCIAHYGSSCQICGFDFGAAYGEEFAGKIHVHHRVPLSEIKADYQVDPVRDLIPVCPNCHLILHGKKDGVYTVEEVRAMRIEDN